MILMNDFMFIFKRSLKQELRNEREINTIQILEIESLKNLVRKLQGNYESINR